MEKTSVDEDSDDEPLAARMEKVKKVKTEPTSSQKVSKRKSMEEDDEYKPEAKVRLRLTVTLRMHCITEVEMSIKYIVNTVEYRIE